MRGKERERVRDTPCSPHVTQLLDHSDDLVDYIVDLSLGGEAAETEAKGGVRHVLGGTKGAQDV